MTDPLTSPQDAIEAESEDDQITCWCGAHGTYREMFASTSQGLDIRCHGTGMLYCHCGGDLCVCHNHGEIECDGCPDCETDEDDFYGDDDDSQW